MQSGFEYTGMASADVEQPPPSAHQHQRDASGPSSSTSILSKFGRSPSRKHKPRPSSESIHVDATLSASIAATKPNRYRPRPGTQRTVTTPDAAVTLNAIKAELAGRKESNATDITFGSPDNNPSMYSVTAISLAEAARTPSFTVKKSDTFNIPDVPPLNGAALAFNNGPGTGVHNPHTLYQHIHDMSSKRIATLDYMRKAHEGRIFWFNTVQFSKSEISKLPSYTPNRQSRRAINYMLLGLSIPAVLDIHPPPHPQNNSATNAAIASDYLRSLNGLLTEFESFQQLHPTDGSSASSLSRARIPQMFKRSVASRPRKSSGAPVAEIGAPQIGAPLQQVNSAPSAVPEGQPGHSHQASVDAPYTNSTFSSSGTTLVAPTPISTVPSTTFPAPTSSAGQAIFPAPGPADAPNSLLLPNEGPYIYLLTPPLPFAPDFHTVFSTLCDVLIDAYTRLQQLLSTPAVCTPAMSDSFSKVDARLRKVMVGGIVREFENASREAVRKEMMGVQRVVLGGLMG